MLAESRKQDLQEITDLLKGMDSISMMIMKSNAAVLLAKQELTESRAGQQADHDSELIKQMADPA